MGYETFGFQLLMNSDFRGTVFDCDNGFCPYPSTIGNNQLSGEDVLNALDIGGISYGKWGA